MCVALISDTYKKLHLINKRSTQGMIKKFVIYSSVYTTCLLLQLDSLDCDSSNYIFMKWLELRLISPFRILSSRPWSWIYTTKYFWSDDLVQRSPWDCFNFTYLLWKEHKKLSNNTNFQVNRLKCWGAVGALKLRFAAKHQARRRMPWNHTQRGFRTLPMRRWDCQFMFKILLSSCIHIIGVDFFS